jgi:hypothetical protein
LIIWIDKNWLCHLTAMQLSGVRSKTGFTCGSHTVQVFYQAYPKGIRVGIVTKSLNAESCPEGGSYMVENMGDVTIPLI